MDKAKFDTWKELDDQLQVDAVGLLRRYCQLERETVPGYEQEDDFSISLTPEKYLSFSDFSTEYICYSGDEFWTYGGHEYHELQLPIRWLYSPDWEAEAKLRITSKFASELKARAVKKSREEAEERAKYARLKKKFEGT